ncbi:MAG TPA: GNAT family N-acetyltransferase [Pseudonocardiaceae bacterium]
MDTRAITAGPVWRLRAELTDRPGTLARLTASLAARDCNILALTVLPVPQGVIDDLIISTPDDLRPADLVSLVRGVGGRCAGITRADPHDLTDGPTSALRAATALIDGSMSYPEAVRTLINADSADSPAAVDRDPELADGAEPTDSPASSGHEPVLANSPEPTSFPAAPGRQSMPDDHADSPAAPGREAVLEGGLRLRRGWSAFTDVELARADALTDLARALDRSSEDPAAVITSDGAAIVLRPGRPTDTDAVAAMHDRCSRASLFARYHTGTRSVPRRLLHRLLAPPRGQTTVGVLGHQVVALGQLINTTDPAIGELSLLVEDDWHGRGVGTALLGYLIRQARAAGYAELVGWCLPGERGLIRTASGTGVPVTTSYEDKLLRVCLNIAVSRNSVTSSP